MHRLTFSHSNTNSPLTSSLYAHNNALTQSNDAADRQLHSSGALADIAQLSSKIGDFGRNSLRRKKAPIIQAPEPLPPALESRVKELLDELENERINNAQCKEQLRSIRRSQQMLERKIAECQRIAQLNDIGGNDETIQDLKKQIVLSENLLKQERSLSRELVSEVSKALFKKAQAENDLKNAKKKVALKGFKLNKKKETPEIRTETPAPDEKFVIKQLSASHEKTKAVEAELQNELEDFVCNFSLICSNFESYNRDKELLVDQSALLHLDLLVELENNAALELENVLLEKQYLLLRQFLISSSPQTSPSSEQTANRDPLPQPNHVEEEAAAAPNTTTTSSSTESTVSIRPKLKHSISSITLFPQQGASDFNPLVSPRKPPRPNQVKPGTDNVPLTSIKSTSIMDSVPYQLTPNVISTVEVPETPVIVEEPVAEKTCTTEEPADENKTSVDVPIIQETFSTPRLTSPKGSQVFQKQFSFSLPPLLLPLQSGLPHTSPSVPSPKMSAASFSVTTSPTSSRLELSNEKSLALGLLSPLPPPPPDSTVSSPLSLLPLPAELPLLSKIDDSEDSWDEYWHPTDKNDLEEADKDDDDESSDTENNAAAAAAALNSTPNV